MNDEMAPRASRFQYAAAVEATAVARLVLNDPVVVESWIATT